MNRYGNPRIRRLCISVDVEKYRRWDGQDQKVAQDALATILGSTCRDAGIDRAAWTRQPAGDGELAVLPPGIDEGRLISSFIRSLIVQLYRYNWPLNEHAQIRLRIAMHVGMTEIAGMGFAGSAPVHVSRLRDSPQLRSVMAEHPDADLALIISQQVYEDHIGHDYPDFQVADFHKVRVELPEKDFSADAWVFVPPGRHRNDSLPGLTAAATATSPSVSSPVAPAGRQPSAPDSAPARHASPPDPVAGLNISAQHMDIGQLAARDIINNHRPGREHRDDG